MINNWLSNRKFKKVLYKSKPIKTIGLLELISFSHPDYLNIKYDYVNDVFISFDMDILMADKPTDKQLDITRVYLNRLLDN